MHNIMSRMSTLKKRYFLFAIVLLLVEIMIATFVNDEFVRPYFGDFLVVMLLYCFMRSLTKLTVLQTCLIVLAFSYFVEAMQYLNIVRVLGLQNSKWASIIIGNSFEWSDIIMYTLGIAVILLAENIRKRKAKI